MAEGDRQGDPRGDHGPVGRVVETRAPSGAAVDLAAIKMRERTDFGGIELTRSSLFWRLAYVRRLAYVDGHLAPRSRAPREWGAVGKVGAPRVPRSSLI